MNKVSIILLGYGNIGKAFVERIEKQKSFFLSNFDLDIEFLLIVRSKTYCKKNQWFDLTNPFRLLQETFLEYPDKKYIIVDCTAAESMIDLYLSIKDVKACIIAANKAPLAVEYTKYLKLQNHFKSNNIAFFHEATVGAGLPIIKPIKSLVQSGDLIHSIQGVFSGTLTYLFSQVNEPFSTRLQSAYDLGYTEPDPRVDLSGLDVARKCLVLARMIGSTLSLSDIIIESLIPDNLESVCVDDFFNEIKSYDVVISKRESLAHSNNQKLCYMGIITKDSIQVGLETVDNLSDFSTLTGTSNLIEVKSGYYPDTYSIKGPGAGIEVTVNGLFSDFLAAILV
ncbi:MAG: hypothetical protein KC646_11810 [Candidatus Cloacimonetes bacterium]|nr:hypothetical protein [Candidatus Cloacimonadota bacterium]